MEPGNSSEYSWELNTPPAARRNGVIAGVCIVVAFGALMFFASGITDGPPHVPARPAAERLVASSTAASFMALIFLLAIGMECVQIVATDSTLRIRRRWFGTRVLSKAQIEWVRVFPAKRSRPPRAILIKHHGRRHPLQLTPSLTKQHPDLGPTLQTLYSPCPEDQSCAAQVLSLQAQQLAQTVAIFPARKHSALRLTIEAVSAGMFLAICISGPWWWRWIVNARPYHLSVTAETSLLLGMYVLIAFLSFGGAVLLDLVLGGRIRSLTVNDDGITIRKLWRTRFIPAKTIKGVSSECASLRREGRTTHVYIHGGYTFRMLERTYTAEPGLIAAVLLLRFGESVDIAWQAPQQRKQHAQLTPLDPGAIIRPPRGQ